MSRVERIGNATLYLGDSRDILPSLPPADVTMTDPPYSPHVHKKEWRSAALTAEGAPRVSSQHGGIDFEALTPELACLVTALSRPTRWFLAFSDIEGLPVWREAVAACGLEYVRSCVWDKVDSAPQFTGDRPANSAELIVCAHPPGRKRWNGGGRRNVLRHAVNGEKGHKEHPTQKPLPLMVELVSLFSNAGETILDPFMGSGSTGIAALALGRSFVGIEAQEKYFEIAVRRLTDAQRQSALLDAYDQTAKDYEQAPLL